MREERLVVTAEVDVRSMPQDDPTRLTREVIKLLRSKADEETAKVAGAELRTDKAPALSVHRGTNPATGVEMWLLWSNWYVWVPEAEAPKLDVVAAP